MTQPIWIEKEEVLLIHEQLLAEHGGASGVRDGALLASALTRPKQYYAYENNKDDLRLGAIYTAGIVKNHPFVDGNKRTRFVIGVLFLELNGYTFNASEEDAACAVLALASGNLEEKEYAEFLRKHCSQHPVR